MECKLEHCALNDPTKYIYGFLPRRDQQALSQTSSTFRLRFHEAAKTGWVRFAVRSTVFTPNVQESDSHEEHEEEGMIPLSQKRHQEFGALEADDVMWVPCPSSTFNFNVPVTLLVSTDASLNEDDEFFTATKSGSQLFAGVDETSTICPCTDVDECPHIFPRKDEWGMLLRKDRSVGANVQSLVFLECHGIHTIRPRIFSTLSHLKFVTFVFCSGVRKVGNNFMANMRNLQAADFRGLSAVSQIGNNFLHNNPALVEIPRFGFHGLENVFSVGDGWLGMCKSLHAVSFDVPLQPSLVTVGDGFLEDSALLALQLDGILKNVETIGAAFLKGNVALQRVSFNGLAKVKTIGSRWMEGCLSLTSSNFVGLSKLEHVGGFWLRGCSSLRCVRFEGLEALRVVSGGWLSGASSLEDVSFVNLGNLVEIGAGFMEGCSTIDHLSFDGLNSVLSIGSFWMQGCDSLASVDFSALGSVQHVGMRWMASCTKIKRVDVSGMQSLETVEAFWLSGCSRLQDLFLPDPADRCGMMRLHRVDYGWLVGDTIISSNAECSSNPQVNIHTRCDLHEDVMERMPPTAVLCD